MGSCSSRGVLGYLRDPEAALISLYTVFVYTRFYILLCLHSSMTLVLRSMSFLCFVFWLLSCCNSFFSYWQSSFSQKGRCSVIQVSMIHSWFLCINTFSVCAYQYFSPVPGVMYARLLLLCGCTLLSVYFHVFPCAASTRGILHLFH